MKEAEKEEMKEEEMKEEEREEGVGKKEEEMSFRGPSLHKMQYALLQKMSGLSDRTYRLHRYPVQLAVCPSSKAGLSVRLPLLPLRL